MSKMLSEEMTVDQLRKHIASKNRQDIAQRDEIEEAEAMLHAKLLEQTTAKLERFNANLEQFGAGLAQLNQSLRDGISSNIVLAGSVRRYARIMTLFTFLLVAGTAGAIYVLPRQEQLFGLGRMTTLPSRQDRQVEQERLQPADNDIPGTQDVDAAKTPIPNRAPLSSAAEVTPPIRSESSATEAASAPSQPSAQESKNVTVSEPQPFPRVESAIYLPTTSAQAQEQRDEHIVASPVPVAQAQQAVTLPAAPMHAATSVESGPAPESTSRSFKHQTQPYAVTHEPPAAKIGAPGDGSAPVEANSLHGQFNADSIGNADMKEDGDAVRSDQELEESQVSPDERVIPPSRLDTRGGESVAEPVNL